MIEECERNIITFTLTSKTMKIMIEVDYSVSFVCKVFDAGFIDNMNMNALSTKVDMHDWK